MRAISYVMLGIAGTMAYQRASKNGDLLSREMRRMMRNNNKSMRKIREIF